MAVRVRANHVFVYRMRPQSDTLTLAIYSISELRGSRYFKGLDEA